MLNTCACIMCPRTLAYPTDQDYYRHCPASSLQAVPHAGLALISAPWPGGLAPSQQQQPPPPPQQQQQQQQLAGHVDSEAVTHFEVLQASPPLPLLPTTRNPAPRHLTLLSASALQTVRALSSPPQAAVRAVRNARAEYGVEPGRRVACTLRIQDHSLLQSLRGEAAVLASLARLDPDALQMLSPEEAAPLTGAKGQARVGGMG